MEKKIAIKLLKYIRIGITLYVNLFIAIFQEITIYYNTKNFLKFMSTKNIWIKFMMNYIKKLCYKKKKIGRLFPLNNLLIKIGFKILIF